MSKYIISGLVVIGLVLSFLLFRNHNRIDDMSSTVEQFEILQQSIISFTENEFNEYLKLKSEQERFKKADELYGKVMLLFLAQLGLKLSEEKMEKLEDMAKAISIGEKSEIQVVSDPYGKTKDQLQCEPCPDCVKCSEIRNTTAFKPKQSSQFSKIIRSHNKIWKNKFLHEKLKPLFISSHAFQYTGNYEGLLFDKDSNQEKEIKLEINEPVLNEKDKSSEVFFSIKTKKMKIEDLILVSGNSVLYHPYNHRHSNLKQCPNIILKLNGIYLSLKKTNLWQGFNLAGEIYSEIETKDKVINEYMGNILLKEFKKDKNERF